MFVNGNADDTVVIDAAEWTLTGTGQGHGEHSASVYTVYTSNSDQTAQLWVDQQVALG
jgi:hypothetical protein